MYEMNVDNSQSTDNDIDVYLKLVMRYSLDDWIMTVTLNHSKQAFLLTSHNALLHIDLEFNPPSHPSPIGQGIKSLLYSGVIHNINGNRILVASGTIFGEVIVWICQRSSRAQKWATITKHLFLGHQGSIFGVAVSDIALHDGQQYRLLASCSDDRTIRLWNISDCDDTNRDVQQHTHSTGFANEHDQNLQLAMAWGHLSRIWNVHFLRNDTNSNSTTHLVSRGEDGVCQFWGIPLEMLDKSRQLLSGKLEPLNQDRHHAGKNVWSSATTPYPYTEVFTGGADGQIISRQLHWNRVVRHNCIPFRDITLDSQPYIKRGVKQYLIFDNETVIATTETGGLARSTLNNLRHWSLIFQPHRTATILCKEATQDLAFYSLADGTVTAYDTATDKLIESKLQLSSQATDLLIASHSSSADRIQEIYFIANLSKFLQPQFITVNRENDTINGHAQTIDLPSDFVVTSCLRIPQQQILILGSRGGALAIVPTDNLEQTSLSSITILRHVHGSDTVTSIKLLPESSSVHVLTTGRDGTFAIHSILQTAAGFQLRTAHRAHPPFGPNIEGADIVLRGVDTWTLRLYGFKSKDFVLWDETQQSQLLSVDCGGAHRTWCYLADCKTGTGALLWTKAGTLNLFATPDSGYEVVQCGGHGREIKALATSLSSGKIIIRSKKSVLPIIIATGAEDTDIRLFKYTSASMKQLAVLRHHTTGLQDLQFSECGQYLFSCGGIEEFLVWKLSPVPVIDIGVVVVGILPKDEDDDDARIMSCDIATRMSVNANEKVFLILLAYSNGKAKLWEFYHNDENNLGCFELLQKLHIGNLCLTQAHILRQQPAFLMLVGATDGALRLADSDVTHNDIILHRVHQSNIAAMTVYEENSESYLVVTGGDDNGLGLTLIQTKAGQAVFSTLLVPSAHAAALTAIAVIDLGGDGESDSILVISAGNDQRVKLWRLSRAAHGNLLRENDSCAEAEDLLTSLHIERIQDGLTDVADVSSVKVVNVQKSDGQIQFQVLVVGVGMQSLQFTLQK